MTVEAISPKYWAHLCLKTDRVRQLCGIGKSRLANGLRTEYRQKHKESLHCRDDSQRNLPSDEQQATRGTKSARRTLTLIYPLSNQGIHARHERRYARLQTCIRARIFLR